MERRADGLVCFEFSIGWPELAVELMLPEAAFEAVAALRGQPSGGYPYPLEAELPAVRDAYRALLAAPAIRGLLRTGPGMERVLPDPTPAKPEKDGPGPCPGPSDLIEFD
jgi:hypothetical protein